VSDDQAFEAARKLRAERARLGEAFAAAARVTGSVTEAEARALAQRLLSVLELYAQGEDPEEESARRLVEAQEQTARAHERARELQKTNEALKRSETQSQHRADQLALLALVMKRVAGILDPERLMQTAAEVVRAERNYTFVAVVVLDDEGMLVGRWAGREGVSRRASGRTQGPARGVIGRALTKKAPQVVPDVQTDSDYHADVPGTRSELVVPLIDEGEPLGVIDFQSERENAFDLDDVVAGEAIAEFLVLALRNARLVAQMRGWS
jgi:GAF domain-containing protein